jgi:hypothetical protein
LAGCLAITALTPRAALAQSSAQPRQTVQEVLAFLLTNQAVPTGDFTRDREASEATRDTIARALLVNLTAQPISSSSSGFSYVFNPELGTFERASESFGPMMAERVQTAGQGQVTIGLAYRFAGFDNLDGREIRNGFLTTANQFADEPEPFDVESLVMELTTHTFVLTANAGVTDRVEVSGAVPLVALKLEGERTNVYRGSTFVQASGTADVMGIGDAIARVKVRLTGARAAGFAVGADFRLPTGREEDLLGAGRAGVRLLAISSFESPYAAAHANAFLARGGLSDETGFAGAVAFMPAPRLTVSGELLLRRLTEVHSIEEFTAPHPSIGGVQTLRLVPGADATTLSLVAGGFKWNVSETWLLNATLAVPVGDRGLTATWVPTVALEYSFR